MLHCCLLAGFIHARRCCELDVNEPVVKDSLLVPNSGTRLLVREEDNASIASIIVVRLFVDLNPDDLAKLAVVSAQRIVIAQIIWHILH